MRQRTRRSAKPDPVRLILRELERREAPSESLSFLAGNIFLGTTVREPAPPVRTVAPASRTSDIAIVPLASNRSSSAPASARAEAARTTTNTPAAQPAPRPTTTAWADPWTGWLDGGFTDEPIRPTQPPTSSDDAGTHSGGGGGGASAAAPAPSRAAGNATAGAAGTAATTGQDAGADPAVAAGSAPNSARAQSVRVAASPTGDGGDTSTSPFPWANQPGGGSLTPAITYGTGTTVFTPATLTHPSAVVDVNKGAVLTEAVINNDFSNWSEDLRAQVSGVTVSTYGWSFDHSGDVTVSGGTSSYQLQFTWNSFTGAAKTEALTLTETFVGGGSQSQTFHFLVAGTDSPAWYSAPTSSGTWPTVETPDMLQAGAAAAAGPHHTISLADGSVSTAINLPAYNPAVPALSLDYNSMAADPRPIFVTRFQIDPSVAVPSTIDARLTVNGTPLTTVTYDTSGDNPGDFVQVALQDDATGLSTGRYTYSVVIKANYGTPVTTTYSGSFNVVNDASSAFGSGWWLSGLDRIVSGTGGVALVEAGGISLWFANGAGTTYTSPAGDFSTLVQNGGGTWTRTLTDGTVEQFDTSGNQTSVADANGNTTTYAYSSGRLSTVTDPYNQVTTFAYDGSNKLATITDPAGRVTDVTVTSGKLTAATDPASGAWAYAYDAAGRMTEITDPDKFTTTFGYDSTAHRASTVNEGDGGTETITPLQVQGLNAGGTTTAVLTAAVTAGFEDGNSHTTSRRLDWLGLGAEMQQTDGAGDVMVTYRDANGLGWLTADGLGRRDRYAFDTHGNVTRSVWADDAHDDYTYNGLAEALTHTNPVSETTTYTYDGSGNLLTSTDALNETTTYAYDARGNRTQSVSPVAQVTYSDARINTYTTSTQAAPKVASDANGDYVVVWQSSGQDGSGYGIYAQRYNAYGQAQGSEFQVNTYTTFAQKLPAVAMDAAGDFVVTWESYGQDGWAYGIYAQRYNAAGTVQGSEFRVNTHTTNQQAAPAVAMDAAGDFVIAWQSYMQDGSAYGVYAQRYNAAGTAQGSEFKVNTYTTGWEVLQSVAMDATGDFVVSWSGPDTGDPTYGVFAQRYNAAGTAQGSEFKVNTYTTELQGFQSVAMDAAGDFVIVWQSAGEDGSGYGIYAQRFNSSGSAQGSEFKVNTFTTGDQTLPAVAMDAAGNFMVAWQSASQDGSSSGVYAQRYTSAGTVIGGEFAVNTYTTNSQAAPAIAMDATGDFIAAWQGEGASDSAGVTARRYRITDLTQYTYDSKSRLTAMTDGEGNTTGYGYDSAGNVITTTDPRGNVTTSTYDNMDRVLSKTLPDDDGNPANNPVWNYAYDGLGQLVSETDPLGNTTTMAYDARGDVTNTVTPITLTAADSALVNTYTTSTQAAAKVASDANGDYVVVWQSSGQDGSGYGIYAQRYNAYGQAQGSEFKVNTYTTGAQSNPSVAMDATGAFVVAWQSASQDGSGDGVYAQQYHADGTTLGSEFKVNTYTTGNQNKPAVAMDSAGDFVVGWESYGQDGSGYGVYAQRYNAAGSAQGSEFRVNTHTLGGQGLQGVAMDAAGDFVITWSGYAELGVDNFYGVYAQRYNAAGTAQGTEFLVNTYTSGTQAFSSIAMDTTGDFVIAWQSLYQDSSGYGVYAQRYNSSGTKQGSEFKVNSFVTGDQTHPAVGMDAAGNYVVSWQSASQDGSSTGVYAKRYTSTGTVIGGEFAVNTYTTNSQAAPAIAMDATGDFIAAWQGEGASDSAGVTARRYRVTALTESTYDYAGNLKTQTDPLDRTTTFTYDAANAQLTQTDPLNDTTTLSYDAAHQVVTSTDPMSRATTYTYNARGQALTVEDPTALTEDFGYDGAGSLISVSYFSSPSLTSVIYADQFGVDALGRQTSETNNSHTTTYAYDVAGNVTSDTDANANATQYAYDTVGDLIATTDPMGDVTRQTFDADRNLVTVTDPLGHTTTYAYDAQDRLSTTKDALNNVTTVTYDLDSRQQTLTDADLNTTTYAYDVAGNQVTTTDPNGHTTTMAFDAAGELTSTIDRDGRAINYTYDAAGRELTETWKPTAATTTVDNIVTYTYNADGQTTEATDFNSTYNYAYNAGTGQLSTMDDVGSPGLPQMTLTYSFNEMGVRNNIQDSLGGRVDYLYNSALQLTNIGLSTIVGTILTAGAQVSMSYDPAGRLSELDRQDGLGGPTIDTDYGYDAANRVTSIGNVSSNVGTLSVFTYAYDTASRVVGYTGPEGGRAYAYDNINQLTTVTNTAGGGTVLESFTYDATGNRTSADGVTYGSPNPGNELVSDGVYSYTYDNEGNTITKSKSGQLWQYTYDERNRLTEAKELSGVGGTVLYDAKYTYDMFGRRIGIEENGTQTLWTFYDDGNAYADFNGSGTLITRYLNGPGLDQRYANQNASTGAVEWYITDNVGSVRELAETNGTVLDTITYDAFGTPTDSNASAGDRFKFTGREWDAGTGQYYYRARYYGPDVGRFTSEDPTGFAAADTDLYRYVLNTPMSRVDPSGLLPPPRGPLPPPPPNGNGSWDCPIPIRINPVTGAPEGLDPATGKWRTITDDWPTLGTILEYYPVTADGPPPFPRGAHPLFPPPPNQAPQQPPAPGPTPTPFPVVPPPPGKNPKALPPVPEVPSVGPELPPLPKQSPEPPVDGGPWPRINIGFDPITGEPHIIPSPPPQLPMLPPHRNRPRSPP